MIFFALQLSPIRAIFAGQVSQAGQQPWGVIFRPARLHSIAIAFCFTVASPGTGTPARSAQVTPVAGTVSFRYSCERVDHGIFLTGRLRNNYTRTHLAKVL